MIDGGRSCLCGAGSVRTDRHQPVVAAWTAGATATASNQEPADPGDSCGDDPEELFRQTLALAPGCEREIRVRPPASRLVEVDECVGEPGSDRESAEQISLDLA